MLTSGRTIRRARWSALTKLQSSSSPRRARLSRCEQVNRRGTTTSTSATARPICSCCLRSHRRLAPCRSHRATYSDRLREDPARLERHPLPQGRKDHPGSGQLEYARAGIAVRSLRTGRGPPDHRAVRMALHAQARQLAQSGLVGTRGSLRPVPRPPHRRRRRPQDRGRCMALTPQHAQRQGRLALHNRRRPGQIKELVSCTLGDSGH